MIQVQGLTRKYGGALAIDDLSFTARPGQVTVLIGPNGAGKSTALRLMLQLERGRGRVLFDGRRYRELRRPAREVGAWLGAAPATPRRRVRAELRMRAVAHGIRRARVEEVLDLVGLAPVAGVRIGELSAGAVGRLGMAAALLGDPRTLILDEPSAGQDPEGVRWLREFLRAYARQGRTVLVAGHGLTELADCADRVLVMARGRLVSDESVADFRRRAEAPRVCVRTPQAERLIEVLRAEGLTVRPYGGSLLAIGGANRARVGEIAFRSGVPIHELAQRDVSVADAFCTLTAEARAFAAERAARDLLKKDAPGSWLPGRASREAARRSTRDVPAYEAVIRPDPANAATVADTHSGVRPDTGHDGADLGREHASVLAEPGGPYPASFAYGTGEKPGPTGPHRRPKGRRWLARPQLRTRVSAADPQQHGSEFDRGHVHEQTHEPAPDQTRTYDTTDTQTLPREQFREFIRTRDWEHLPEHTQARAPRRARERAAPDTGVSTQAYAREPAPGRPRVYAAPDAERSPQVFAGESGPGYVREHAVPDAHASAQAFVRDATAPDGRKNTRELAREQVWEAGPERGGRQAPGGAGADCGPDPAHEQDQVYDQEQAQPVVGATPPGPGKPHANTAQLSDGVSA